MKLRNSNAIKLNDIQEAISTIKEDLRDINLKLDYVIELYGELRYRQDMENHDQS